MLSWKYKIPLLIFSAVALLASAVVCVPFSTSTIANSEVALKYVLIPLIIALCFIANAFVRYISKRKDVKFVSVASYLPIFAYLTAAGFFTVATIIKTPLGFEKFDSWMINLAIILVITTLVAFMGHFVYRFILSLKTSENILLDCGLVVLLVAGFVYYRAIASKYTTLTYPNPNAWTIVVSILIALLMCAFLALRLVFLMKSEESYKNISKKELLERWHKGREAVYAQAEIDILYNLYEFSKSELGILEEYAHYDCKEEFEDEATDEVVEEVIEEPVQEMVEELAEEPVQEVVEELAEESVHEPKPAKVQQRKIVEFEHVVEQPVVEVVKRVVELENPELENISSELEKLNEEYELLLAKKAINEVEKQALLAGIEASQQQKEKPARPPKDIKPTFDQLVGYAKALDGATYKANEAGTNYKFSYNNKPFLYLADTPRDYRLTFLINLDDVAKYAVKTPSFVKAKSPNGENWFKIINKGDVEEQLLFELIDQSIETIKGMIQKVQEDRERQRREKAEAAAQARLEAKLAAMTPEQRAQWEAREAKKAEKARLAALEAERLAAMTPEEIEAERLAKLEAEADKIRQEAEREAEKIRQAAEREAEKARLAREKEIAKQKALEEKARLAAEREAAKQKALEEKEAEKARLAAEREAAKLKAQEEKEAEKARLAAEREAAKQKALEEKEAEKARLAAEREAAKQKAQEEKEAEKARLAKEKAREAAKAKAQKEKEAEKARLAKEKEREAAKAKAQKEKEAEKARLAKEKEREAAKAKAQKEKEAEKARLAKEKEREAAKAKAQKEKEAAKAKALALKEKEAAKAKAQKEKEAAKLKAQKEKEREAAKAKALKEKEAAKTAKQAASEEKAA